MKSYVEILTRYSIVLVVVILSVMFNIFYFVFLPLTIWPVIGFLNLFYQISIYSLTFFAVSGFPLEIIGACIAPSAFLLLFILNFLTSGITIQKRILILVIDFAALLFLNIIRLIILTILYINNSFLFGFTHKLFWYVLSTIFVFLVWILTIKLFKIKEVPIVSDFKNFIFEIKSKT